ADTFASFLPANVAGSGGICQSKPALRRARGRPTKPKLQRDVGAAPAGFTRQKLLAPAFGLGYLGKPSLPSCPLHPAPVFVSFRSEGSGRLAPTASHWSKTMGFWWSIAARRSRKVTSASTSFTPTSAG